MRFRFQLHNRTWHRRPSWLRHPASWALGQGQWVRTVVGKTAKTGPVWAKELLAVTRPVMGVNLQFAAWLPGDLFAVRQPNADPASRLASWGSLLGWVLLVWWELPLLAAIVDSEISAFVRFCELLPTEPPRRLIGHGERLLHFWVVGWMSVELVPTSPTISTTREGFYRPPQAPLGEKMVEQVASSARVQASVEHTTTMTQEPMLGFGIVVAASVTIVEAPPQPSVARESEALHFLVSNRAMVVLVRVVSLLVWPHF
mmetsp:Transcript_671/g.1306  ORF Transcript_671/g.1306 Transcript_671/m.1306 type:complete len:258 (+) Transcript_671:3208-3981(+)